MKTKNLYFYFLKLLRRISKCSLTITAKQQLNDIIVAISIHLIQVCVYLSKRTVLSVSTLVNASRFLLSGELLQNTLKEGDLYKSQQNTAPLILPCSFFRQLVVSQIPKHIKVSSEFAPFLTAMMEYISVEILELASIQAVKGTHSRITPRDIFLAVSYDSELLDIIRRCKITLLGVGVIPHQDELDKESQKLQKTTHLLLPKLTFERIVRGICSEIEPDPIKISKPTFTLLQEYTEYFLMDILKQTEQLCQAVGKQRITEQELTYIYNNNN